MLQAEQYASLYICLHVSFPDRATNKLCPCVEVKRIMIAVIFEVFPAEGKVQEYLDISAELKPQLEKIDGFISIERFSSLVVEGKVLSLSFWRDEEAIEEWRNIESHRHAQEKGRKGVFADYRLRVANVSRDYGMTSREQAPNDSKLLHDKSN